MTTPENQVATDPSPHPLLPTEIDSAVESFISGLEKEQDDAALAAMPESPPGEVAPQKTEAVTPPVGTPEAPKTTDVDRGLERLVQREMELKGREDAIKGRDAEFNQLRLRLQELESKKLPDNVNNALSTDPDDVLRQLGHDPEQIVRLVLAKKMGDKAPPELQRAIRDAQAQSEVKALRDQVMQFQRNQQAQQYVAGIEAGARTYISQGVSKDAPTVAAVAKANPDRVHQEIMDEIGRDAREKSTKEPGAPVLPYDEAARRVEKRWGEMKSLLGIGSTPASTDTTKTAQGTSPVTSTPPAKPATPPKPLQPWHTRNVDELQEQGIQAALAEFRRAESATRN
jgi:hypothetical protein